MLSFTICDLINSKKPLSFISERKTKRNGVCVSTAQILLSKCLQDCGVRRKQAGRNCSQATLSLFHVWISSPKKLQWHPEVILSQHMFSHLLCCVALQLQRSTLVASTLVEIVTSRNTYAFPLTITQLKQWYLRNWDFPGNLMLGESKRGRLVSARQGSCFPGKEFTYSDM